MTAPAMTILLTGGTGQVGWELQRTLAPLGRVVAPLRAELDLTRPDSLRAAVRGAGPGLIVNAAAHTAVDQAESEPELAMALNGEAPGILAEEAKRLGIPLVHYSTDYVFDGRKAQPYAESDAPNPVSVYGRTKLAGERAIQAVGAAHLILRTSWVYGARGKNFMRTILRLAREREQLNLVNDQIGAPTWSRLIAEATAAVLARHIDPVQGMTLGERGGLYHLTCAGSTSWFGFASAIADGDPDRQAQKLRTLAPIPTSGYPTPARRPANSRLDCAALRQVFGIALPDWADALQLVLADLAGSQEISAAPGA